MADAPKKRARTKVTSASLEIENLSAKLQFEHRGQVLLDSHLGRGSVLVTLPTTDEAWSAGQLQATPLSVLVSDACVLRDGSVLGLLYVEGQGKTLADVDLSTGAWRALARPADWESAPDHLIALRGDALAIATWADRVRLGYDGVMLATGERLAVPRADPRRPASELQVYSFGGDAGASLVVADGAAYVWKPGSVEPIANASALRAYNFGQQERAVALDDGRLVLCCGDVADTGRHATAYRSFTARWFDTDGRTGVFDPSIEYATCGWAGPDGALIMAKTEASTEHLLEVLWTRERAVSAIPRSWARYRKFVHDVVYSRTARALVCLQLHKRGLRVTAIPWREIEALERAPLG